MTFLRWLIESHIQELEEELKLLKNHSQPNIVVSNESFLDFFTIGIVDLFDCWLSVLISLPPITSDSLYYSVISTRVITIRIWDAAVLTNGVYGDIADGTITDSDLKTEKLTHYIENPRPIEPPAEAAPPPPQPLKLTKREQKKLRTQRPTQDPTKLEKEIRTAAAEREQAHTDRNAARKLTPKSVFLWSYGPSEREREREKVFLCEKVLLMGDGRTLLDGEETLEEILDLISEEAGALATAEGTKSLNSSFI
ncbi:BnaC04g32040D [Brassica napus]|uniref:BnaC04g32040D protein n=1 Tax=Brassica napus TaxID=3708 RepID=A0A078HGD3_BRANA|nr:BnaC04g32040D [Brassica napus]